MATTVRTLRNFIGGDWVESTSEQVREIVSPVTGELVAEAPDASPEDVERGRPGSGELLQQMDVIAAAQSFPVELTGYEDLGRALEAMAREYPASVVCVTLGEEGSLALCGGREVRTPAFAVDCVDSTGAGDAFRGGFAAGVLRFADGDIEDVLRYANAVAALNCRRLGARGGMPRLEEVDELLCASQTPRGHA